MKWEIILEILFYVSIEVQTFPEIFRQLILFNWKLQNHFSTCSKITRLKLVPQHFWPLLVLKSAKELNRLFSKTSDALSSTEAIKRGSFKKENLSLGENPPRDVTQK